MNQPRLIQTYLLEGNLEGARVIELSESSIKALVVPRIKLNQVKDRPEVNQPSLYLLINSGDNQIYIGESENFYHRIKNHDQSKDFWDLAVAIVSNTDSLEKGDVKYLESLAVEKAKATAASEILNKTVPARNNVHEFKLHTLQKILEDIGLLVESLGFSVFTTKQDTAANIWYCKSKKTDARAQYSGDKFVVLAGSRIDATERPSFEALYPSSALDRRLILQNRADRLTNGFFVMKENVSFKSPNQAASFCIGGHVNAWTTWKNAEGKTMDEVMRKRLKISDEISVQDNVSVVLNKST